MAKKRVKKRVKKSASAVSSREVEEVLDGDDRVNFERELRRFVKKNGGPRKGLPDKAIKRAMGLSRMLGRPVSEPKKLKWDLGVFVPGLDNPTVKGMVIAD